MSRPDLPRRCFATRGAWNTWLARHHATSPGIVLEIAKQASGNSTVSYDEALDLAIAYGWIDGKKERLDDNFWLQRFTPRAPKGRWSQRNRAKALALIADGAMHPAGLREVERARADGRWDAAYAGSGTATVPEDLQRALNKNKRASAFFATIDSRNRYAILYRVDDAKKPETRARRIEKFVAMLAEGKTIHP